MDKIYFIREKSSKFGGAEVYLSRLEKSLRSQKVDCEVMHSIFPKFLPSWLRIILFNLQVCLAKRDRFYFSLERIVCPDVYRAGDGVHKMFLKTEKKSKLNPLHPIYQFLEKRCFQNAKRIIANSNMIKDEIVATYGINYTKISVVYNGIELKEFNQKESFERLSKEFNMEDQSTILLYVGSGFKRKGVGEFLAILSKLELDASAKAFVIGKEKNIEHYKRLSQDLGVANQVIFTGPRDDVDDFYAISDIFILPTHYEPFSNTILEAMSFGNVVITTKQNGASEIIPDQFVMKNPKDMDILGVIQKVISDDDSMEHVKKANRKIARQYSIDQNTKETLKVVNELLCL